MLKMYILVRDSIDLGHAMVGVAHATAALYERFAGTQPFDDWRQQSFRKVICKVTDAQFEEAKRLIPGHCLMTESGLGGVEVALGFCPCEQWPAQFKYYSLYR